MPQLENFAILFAFPVSNRDGETFHTYANHDTFHSLTFACSCSEALALTTGMQLFVGSRPLALNTWKLTFSVPRVMENV